MSRSAEALQRRTNAHIARRDAGTCKCQRCIAERTANGVREHYGLPPIGRGGNGKTALQKRTETARVVEGLANIIRADCRKGISKYEVGRIGGTIQLTIDGVAYNISVTRARLS